MVNSSNISARDEPTVHFKALGSLSQICDSFIYKQTKASILCYLVEELQIAVILTKERETTSDDQVY